MSTEELQDTAEVRAEKIGGIDETDVVLQPGVNVLTGRNATNRTSFLQAIMAALGSDEATLKGDASAGSVELDLDGKTHTRTLTRTEDGVAFSGDPYLDDAEFADLFAFLLEENEARQVVARQGDLREVIMQPVDTEQITADIEQCEAEKRRIDERLDELDGLKDDLTSLEQRRAELRQDIEQKREELDAKRAELDQTEADVATSRDQQTELDDALDDLQRARSDLEDVEFRLETQHESLDALEGDRAETESELDELPETSEGRISEIEAEIERLRAHRESLNSTVSQLQRVVQFNDEMLKGTNEDVLGALQGESAASDITDRLLDDTVVCWTCGSEVQHQSIETTLETLRELRQEKVAEHRQIKDELEQLQSERKEHVRKREERERLREKLRDIESRIEERAAAIEDLEAERDDLEAEVSELEAHVESLEQQTHDEVLSLQKEANQLEFELEQLRNDLEETTDRIEEIESRLDEEETLESEREEIQARLTDLRTRIEQLETDAVEAFNDHMQTILDILGYENLDRIWLERTERTVREGRRKVSKSTYDLHVVRTTEDGTSYEDTIRHLSESEREVTGLVFALAGYLVHAVHEELPFMLLDSLEAVDSERIAQLVNYFSEYAPYLVIALLPEDAAALSDEYHRVTTI